MRFRRIPTLFLFTVVCIRHVPVCAFSLDAEVNRRDALQGCLTLVLATTSTSKQQLAAPANAADAQPIPETITIPLKWNGEAYLIYYRINGRLFRAVLDTGSPFLTVPGTCDASTKARWGCYKSDMSEPSGLAPTYELFDGVEGEVEWRSAPFAFVNATGSMMGPPSFLFGVLSESLMTSPGGVFFGLVRDTDGWIRPSFLGQTFVRSFQLDLISELRTLTLSTQSMIPRGGDYIRLVSDLRGFGDPTLHYTARAKAIHVNGSPLGAADGKPIYCIFDTGVTGLVVSQELFDERYVTARHRRERSLWGDVAISFRSKKGTRITLTAKKPVTTPLALEGSPWKVNGHLIVVGLSFLNDNKLVIDIDDEKLWIEEGPAIDN